MAFDFKKEYKKFYMPKNIPEIVTVPKANFIAVRGKGNPNDVGGSYQQAGGVLYAVAYTLKMRYLSNYQIKGFFEYAVPPLEGFWWQEGIEGVDYSDKSEFCWIYVCVGLLLLSITVFAKFLLSSFKYFSTSSCETLYAEFSKEE